MLVEHLRLIDHLGCRGGLLHALHRLCGWLLYGGQLSWASIGLLHYAHLQLWLHVLQVHLSLMLCMELTLKCGGRLKLTRLLGIWLGWNRLLVLCLSGVLNGLLLSEGLQLVVLQVLHALLGDLAAHDLRVLHEVLEQIVIVHLLIELIDLCNLHGLL